MALTQVPSGMLASSAQFYNFKNRIINGEMDIDQRNVGASITQTTSITYSVDRWGIYGTAASKFTAQQNAGSVTPPAGFVNYLGITSASAYSISSSDIFMLYQGIEGFNVADLGWGTANAQTVTLSFRVRSSLTGTFGGVLSGASATRTYPFTYTISSANTWTTISVTIPGDTSGAWLTNNGLGIGVKFGLGVGSTYSAAASSWAAGDYYSATGATSVVGTNGATFYITGVQLEAGSTATSFDFRSYGTELALCQRYYYKTYNQGVALGTSTFAGIWSTTLTQSNQGTGYIEELGTPTSKVTMRASPTITVYDRVGNIGKASYYAGSSIVSNYSWTLNTAAESGFSWYSDAVTTKGGVAFHYTSSAEL